MYFLFPFRGNIKTINILFIASLSICIDGITHDEILCKLPLRIDTKFLMADFADFVAGNKKPLDNQGV
jgi:hypothetical protein